MKKHLIFILGIAMVAHPAVAVNLDDLEQCPLVLVTTSTAACGSKTTGYACPSCYVVEYTCPTGWSALKSSTCTRSSTTLAADSKGYRQQNYGTCTGTESKTYSYRYSTVQMTDSNGRKLCMNCGGI